MKKKMLSMMTLALAVVMSLTFASPVKADSEDYANYAKVEKILNGDVNSVDFTITGNGTANTVINVSKFDLKWSPANPDIGRVNGWWIGAKISAPTELKEDNDLKASTMMRKGLAEPKSFNAVKDSSSDPHYINVWLYVDNTMLNSIKTYTYTFTWSIDDVKTTQTITFNIDGSQEGTKLGTPAESGKTNGKTYVSVQVKGNGAREFFLEEGKTLGDLEDTDKADLESIKTPQEGYEFIGLFDEDDKEFDESSTISSDTVLTAKFKEIVVEQPAAPETPNTPQTFDGITIVAILGLISVIGIAFSASYLRKSN